MWSSSGTMLRLIRSLKVSLMAVSGAIFSTFVPLPRKNALSVPAHRACRSKSAPLQAIIPQGGYGLTLGDHAVPALTDGEGMGHILDLQQHLDTVYWRSGCA